MAPGEPLDPRLGRALRRGRRITLERLVAATETSGTVDRRAQLDLPLALRVLGRPRDPRLRAAMRGLRTWMRAGGHRVDRDRDGAYEHAAAIRLMDAWWPLWVRAELEPSLGAAAFGALADAANGAGRSDGAGPDPGPAFDRLVQRDLQAALARRSRTRRTAFCGRGRRTRCRRLLARTLREAGAIPAATLYSGRPGCADGDQACHDAIRFDHLGAAAGPVLPWIERPTYQQAVSVRRRVPPPPPSCGGIRHVWPPGAPLTSRPPLLIGDSVTMGALPETAAAGFEVDARGCRGFGEGVELLRLRAAGRTLPALVVMELGTDGSVRRRQIEQALRVLGRRRVLALVTPREVFGHGHADATAMRAAGRRHRRRVVVADWVVYSRGHASWFQPDEVHLTLEGAREFAGFLDHKLARARSRASAPVARPARLLRRTGRR